MSNMNINNKPIQQRIEELQKKSQSSETVNKQPVETGIDRSTFEQRKAVFEQQSKTQSKPESIVSESVESELEESIEQVKPEGLQQRTQKLSAIKPGEMLSYTTPLNDQGNYSYTTDTSHNYNQPFNYQNNKEGSDGYQGSEGYNHVELNLKPQTPKNPGKYQQTSENHHKPESRTNSNVEGIQRGFEFALRGRSSHTAMFKSDEAQKDNLLSFDKSGVKRGDSQENLSTQTESTGIWAGSKNNRMLFVMSPEGKIYALDPSKPITHKGATVLDVRIHHSSLLNGERVAGAGEIQVSAGLTPQELDGLQNQILKKVQEKVSNDKDINPESAQKLIAKLVDEELGRILKHHQPGQVEVISDRSGHYRPDLKMTAQVLSELEEQGVDIERVNVELGDKTNNFKNPEGELMVPSRTVLSIQNNKDAENVLRGENARKQNMHKELLSKVNRVESIDGDKGEVESEQAIDKINKSQDELFKYLRFLVTEGKFEKAAALYERATLMGGVETDVQAKSGNRIGAEQEQKILSLIITDQSFTFSERSSLKEAYQQLLVNRQQNVEIRRVETEDPFADYDDYNDKYNKNDGYDGETVVNAGYFDQYGKPLPENNISKQVVGSYFDKDGNQINPSQNDGQKNYLRQNQDNYSDYKADENSYNQGYGVTNQKNNYQNKYLEANNDD